MLVVEKIASSTAKAELRVAVELYSAELRREAEEHAAATTTADRDLFSAELTTPAAPPTATAVLARKKETKFYLTTSNSSIKVSVMHEVVDSIVR